MPKRPPTPRVTRVQSEPGSTRVRVGDQAVPARFVAVVDPGGPYLVELGVRVTNRAEVLSLIVGVKDWAKPGSITAVGLRQLRLAEFLRLALEAVAEPIVDDAVSRSGFAFRMPGDALNVYTRGAGITPSGSPDGQPRRGRRPDLVQLERAAQAYREALGERSRHPVDDVARQMHTSYSNASRWIQQARKRGFLGAALGRQAGEAPITTPISSARPTAPDDETTHDDRTLEELKALGWGLAPPDPSDHGL